MVVARYVALWFLMADETWRGGARVRLQWVWVVASVVIVVAVGVVVVVGGAERPPIPFRPYRSQSGGRSGR